MALNQKFNGHLLTPNALTLCQQLGLGTLAKELPDHARGTSIQAQTLGSHTLELYLDYVCPFSKKQFMGLFEYLRQHGIPDGVRIIFRHQVQPWHPSSTLLHEAALAVATAGDLVSVSFWPYSYILFENQEKFFDVNVVNETRNKTYQRLMGLYDNGFKDLATPALLERLIVSDKPGEDGALNVGNKVTDDLKLCIKLGRQTGIHVSPTVLWDGLVENSISSSFGEKEWAEFFKKHITNTQPMSN